MTYREMRVYKLLRPDVTKEDLDEARKKGFLVRLKEVHADYYVYTVNGYRVRLSRR